MYMYIRMLSSVHRTFMYMRLQYIYAYACSSAFTYNLITHQHFPSCVTHFSPNLLHYFSALSFFTHDLIIHGHFQSFVRQILVTF